MAFLGIKIPLQTARLLSEIEVPGKNVGMHEMHVTILMFEDNWPIAKIAEALESTYDIVSKIEPFTIKTKKISCFPPKEGKPHPIIALVESEELHEVNKKLRKKFNKDEIEFDKTFKKYNPHITLSYADKEIKDIKIDPVEVVVQELVLFGGDKSDRRIFVTFPLKSPEKHGALVRKCEVFEKWAQDLQAYHELMKKPILGPDVASDMLRDYKAHIESHPQDLLDIAEKVRNDAWSKRNPRLFIGWVTHYIDNPAFAQKIKDHWVTKLTSEYESGRRNMLPIISMEDFFTTDQMRALLGKLVERLVKGDEDKETVADLETLIIESEKLNKTLLMRLMRQFAPNTFAKLYGKEIGMEAGGFTSKDWLGGRGPGGTFFQRAKYDTNDIIWFIEKFGDSAQYQDFARMIERSTGAAKKMLQSILWAAGTGKNEATLFILDPNMEPLSVDDDGNQSNPVLTPTTWIDRAPIISSSAKSPSPYLTLMHDYRIIPYSGTFSHTTDAMEWAKETASLMRRVEIFEKLAQVKGFYDPLTSKEYETKLREVLKEQDPGVITAFIENNKETIKQRKRTDLLYLTRAARRYFMRSAPHQYYLWVSRLARIDPEFTKIVQDEEVAAVMKEPQDLGSDIEKWDGFIQWDWLPLEGFLSNEQVRGLLKLLLERVDFEKASAAELLKRLLYSHKLNKQLLLRLLRQINPIAFSDSYQPDAFRMDDRRKDRPTFTQMEKYTIDDIVYLIEKHGQVFYKELQHIIAHATPQAQNLLRRVLWETQGEQRFILDETMKPVTLDFSEGKPDIVEFVPNKGIAIGATGNVRSDEWFKLFDDYGIVPYPGTFVTEKHPGIYASKK